MRFDADTGIHREVAALEAPHFFGPKTLRQAASVEGAQNAFAQGGCAWVTAVSLDADLVKDNAWLRGYGNKYVISLSMARHRLKHHRQYRHESAHARSGWSRICE